MIIDLHGLTTEESVGKIEMAILSFQTSSYDDTLEIITGHGTGVLKALVEDILYDYRDLSWSHSNGNTGSYLIKKI